MFSILRICTCKKSLEIFKDKIDRINCCISNVRQNGDLTFIALFIISIIYLKIC